MSKIICDICGTTYPDSAEQCPICGFTRDPGTPAAAEDFLTEQPQAPAARSQVKGGRFSAANVRKRTQSEPHYEPRRVEDDDDDDDDDLYPAGAPKQDGSNKPLVILLIILIIGILITTGFIVVKYFLPNLNSDDTGETEEQTEEESSTTEETEEPTIPCTELTLLDGTGKDFDEIGQFWLLNVDVQPADTTDELLFASSDESVATVNAEGRIEAVAEGEAIITVTCGDLQKEFTVVVAIEPETEPTEPETEPTEPETEPTEPEPVTKTVVVDKLTIRSGAGTSYEKVGRYVKGDKVVIYEEVEVKGDTWGRTDKGWICTEYVE